MQYIVINGELTVNHIRISSITTSSILFIGDVKSVELTSAFETPPEETIVGVTVPLTSAEG